MADQFSIAEISRLTGLASHTLRYYEQQFPVLLDVERSRGGHRIYRRRHLDTISAILRLLKEEKVSIRRAREILGEPESATVKAGNNDSSVENADARTETAPVEVSRMLTIVLDRLDSLCRNSEKRDQMLYELLQSRKHDSDHELLVQISRCRRETHETVKLCQAVMQQRFKSN